jgi:hypothetical protein
MDSRCSVRRHPARGGQVYAPDVNAWFFKSVRGSHRRLADAIGFVQKRKLGEVPSFVCPS